MWVTNSRWNFFPREPYSFHSKVYRVHATAASERGKQRNRPREKILQISIARNFRGHLHFSFKLRANRSLSDDYVKQRGEEGEKKTVTSMPTAPISFHFALSTCPFHRSLHRVRTMLLPNTESELVARVRARGTIGKRVRRTKPVRYRNRLAGRLVRRKV